MSEPPAKIQKMDNESSGSIIDKEEFFNPQTQDFAQIRLKPTFVDHTELVNLFLGDIPRKLFVTAPSHFCKSTNLSMLKLFYGIKRDGTLEPKLEDRHMFHVFRDTKIMETKDQEALVKHFCAHPVLYVDFKILGIGSYENALRFVLEAVVRCFSFYETFLLANLKGSMKDRFQSKLKAMIACDELPTITCDGRFELLAKEGLKFLCECLYNAYGSKRVLILVDEADAVVTAALTSGVDSTQIRNIANLMADLLGNITKGEIEEQIQGVLLTGISNLKGVGYSDKVKATSHRFLDDNKKEADHGDTTVSMYGITEEQLDILLDNLQKKNLLKYSTDRIKTTINEYYNGYITSSGGIRVYSLWSVLYYLKSMDTSSVHANMTPIAKYYKKAFKSTLVAQSIIKLLAGEAVEITYVKKLTIENLVNLRDRERECVEHRDILLSLLMEVGFLTNAKQERAVCGENLLEKLRVEMPNKEVKNVFKTMLKDDEVQLGKFDLSLIRQCGEEIDSLVKNGVSEITDSFKQHLKSLYNKLTRLCQQFEADKINEAYLKVLITMIMQYTELKEQPEYYRKEDGGYVDVIATDNEHTCLWEMKMNRQQSENKTSMWAMKEIRGDQDTKKKGYMNVARRTNKFLLLGLSLNEKLQPSLCALLKGQEKGVFISESEHNTINFKKHYQGWHDLLKETDV